MMEKTGHTTNQTINRIITELEEKQLTETAKILRQGNLTLHPAIAAISIHGSRGPQGGYRPDSDLDLSLVLKKDVDPTEELCSEALRLTLDNWRGEVEPDNRQNEEKVNNRCDKEKPDSLCDEEEPGSGHKAANVDNRHNGEEPDRNHNDVELDCVVVFDKKGCGLSCFDHEKFDGTLCKGGTDCLGLYKIQRGYSGFVPECGVKVEMMFPFVRVRVGF